MLRRLEVHAKILAAVPPNVPIIFRPSQTHRLTYPCVVYNLVDLPVSRANDSVYVMAEVYEVSVLSNLPGVVWSTALLSIPGTSFLRNFTHDDVVHDIFRIQHMSI